jgi:hypothetical protein
MSFNYGPIFRPSDDIWAWRTWNDIDRENRRTRK